MAETKAATQRTADPSNTSYFSQIKGGLLYAQNQPMNAIFSPLAMIRKMKYETFDPDIWNIGRSLPSGLAAIGASLLSSAVVIPGMDTVWYSGPIGRVIGDIGFEVAMAVTALAYYPLRQLEIRWLGHL